MQISDKIADFTQTLEAARGELNTVLGKISELEAKRNQVENEPIHAEEIAKIFMSGLDQAEKDFEAQLKAHLSRIYQGSSGNGRAVAGTPNLMRIEPRQSDPASSALRASDGTVAINANALVYFLRDKIAPEIPELIARLCPDASKGLKKADRRRKLDEIDRELSDLRGQRDALQANLAAARSAVIR